MTSCNKGSDNGGSGSPTESPTGVVTLAVTMVPSTGGLVVSDHAGIVCGLDCSAPYITDTSVTLTVTEFPGYSFVNWSGDCTGVTTSAIVPMSQDKACTAGFDGSSSFTTIDIPGALSTSARGINDSGQIVGGYDSIHGFCVQGTGHCGSPNPIDVPGAASTTVYGITDGGQIVGTYRDSSNFTHGFSCSGDCSNYQRIDYPEATYTEVHAINRAGQVVGIYQVSGSTGSARYGFLCSGNCSSSAIQILPGISAPEPFGINNAGQIVGNYRDSNQVTHGFLCSGDCLTLTTIDVEGSSSTKAFGINTAGQIVGVYSIGTSHQEKGFLYSGLPNGTFSSIGVPGASATEAFGINDTGQIVGDSISNTASHGFLR